MGVVLKSAYCGKSLLLLRWFGCLVVWLCVVFYSYLLSCSSSRTGVYLLCGLKGGGIEADGEQRFPKRWRVADV